MIRQHFTLFGTEQWVYSVDCQRFIALTRASTYLHTNGNIATYLQFFTLITPMANIKFKLQEIPHASSEEAQGYYPQITDASHMSVAQLCKAIEGRCTANRADIMAVVSALADVIGEQLVRGDSVEVPELGTFSPTLTCSYPITSLTDKQVARHLRLKGIKFRPKKKLTDKLSNATFTRSTETEAKRTTLTQELAMERITQFFDANPDGMLDRAAFQRIAHANRMQALRMLKLLTDAGRIVKKGRTYAPYFVLPPIDSEK